MSVDASFWEYVAIFGGHMNLGIIHHNGTVVLRRPYKSFRRITDNKQVSLSSDLLASLFG